MDKYYYTIKPPEYYPEIKEENIEYICSFSGISSYYPVIRYINLEEVENDGP